MFAHQGKHAEAESLQSECLEIQRRVLGPEHPDTLLSMGNLANLYSALGKHAEEETLMIQALGVQRRVLGPEHPETLRMMNNLAAMYWQLNKLDRSIPLFEEALMLTMNSLGVGHPETLNTLANLGVNYMVAGRLEEALPLLEESYRAVKDYPSLRWVGVMLLDDYVRSQRIEQAKVLATELLTEARATLPKDSRQLAVQLVNIARQLLKLNAWSDAEIALREVLPIRERRDPDNWGAFNTRFMLGQALLGQQKFDEASPLLIQGFEGVKQRESQIPPIQIAVDLIEALERLVRLYEAIEKNDEAAKWRNELEAAKKRLADKKG